MPMWTVHIEGGPRRVNHAAASVSSMIFMFGGYCSDDDDNEDDRDMDVFLFDTVSFRWREVPSSNVVANPPSRSGGNNTQVPSMKYGHTVCSYGEHIYLWGGRNDRSGVTNVLYRLDTRTMQWSVPPVNGHLPLSRDGHSACVINHIMYIFGGFEDEMEQFCNSIYTLNLTTMTWKYIYPSTGQMPLCRDFHTASGVDDSMYVFGGRMDKQGEIHTGEDYYCNHIAVFNTVTNKWNHPQCSGTIPLGRRSHTAFYHNRYLYIFAGYNSVTNEHFNDLHRFNIESSTWSEVTVLGEIPRIRRRMGCCLVGEKVYVFGGTSPALTWRATDFEDGLIELSDLHVLEFVPSLKTLCELAVLEYGLDISCLPMDIRWELSAITKPNTISRPVSG